ncbi:hypothetical protein ACWEV3_40200 [Saccharopolyspora sp. NPDC003752]
MTYTIRTLDDSPHIWKQSYEYVEIAKINDRYIVRATVRRDFYEQQSYAKAEVLATDAMTWTHLVNEPTDTWFAATASPHAKDLDPVAELARITDGLTMRAATILTT